MLADSAQLRIFHSVLRTSQLAAAAAAAGLPLAAAEAASATAAPPIGSGSQDTSMVSEATTVVLLGSGERSCTVPLMPRRWSSGARSTCPAPSRPFSEALAASESSKRHTSMACGSRRLCR